MYRRTKICSLLALLLLLNSCSGSTVKYELVDPAVPLEAIEKRLHREFVDIDFDRVVEEDPSLTPGTYYLAQRGRKGQTEVQYTVIYVKGVEARRYEMSKRIIKQPIREILVLGPALRGEDVAQEHTSTFAPSEIPEPHASGTSANAADASSSLQTHTPNDFITSESNTSESASSQTPAADDSTTASEYAPDESSSSESNVPGESSSSGNESSDSSSESSDDVSSSNSDLPVDGTSFEQPPEELLNDR